MQARLPERPLTARDATLLVMGGILGVGIFFTPAQVAALSPGPGAFLLLWAAGALVALCGAFTFAEYGASLPEAGGWYVYLRRVWPPVVAFLFAWVVLLVVSTGAMASIARFGLAQAAVVLPFLGEEGSVANRVGATALLLGTTVIALGGVKLSAAFQGGLMLLKLLAVLALVVAGLALARPATEAAAIELPRELGRPAWQALLVATLPLLYSFGGWQMLGYVASEVRDARRVLPRAILLGVGGVSLAYLLLNLAYLRVLGLERISGDFAFAGEMAARCFGASGSRLLAAAIALSAVGIIAVNVIASPWIYVAMAREGVFFRRFAALHPRTGAPVLALCVQAVLTIFYIWAGTLARLVESVVFAEWFFHGLVAFGLLRLRRLHPELERPFRSPLYPLAPVLYGLVAAGVVSGSLWQADAATTFPGLAVIAAGLALYPIWSLVYLRSPRAQGADLQ